MNKIIIGSARRDENGNYSGGAKGDQTQTDNRDFCGEVSLQEFYEHKKGWYVLRAKDKGVSIKLAEAMLCACSNSNLGYSQSDRYSLLACGGVHATQLCNCDCSSLIRACVIAAADIDPGDFTTVNEIKMLKKTGLFCEHFALTYESDLQMGDILITRKKGHTAIVVEGVEPQTNMTSTDIIYYNKCTPGFSSIVDALISVGEANISFLNRSKIARMNNIPNYSGSYAQNITLLELLKKGILIKEKGE